MKTLTAAALAEIAKQVGTEPFNEVDVDWNRDDVFTNYTDKDKIIALSGVASSIKLGSTGSTGDMSVTLDDTDGSIKALIDANDIHKAPVRIYQTYEGLAPADRFLVFTGQMSSPIIWSEAARTVSFQVVGRVEDAEIGFAPEEGEFDFIAKSAVGKAWPICFGTPIRVPAQKITEKTTGSSLTIYDLITSADLEDVCSSIVEIVDKEADIAEFKAEAEDLETGKNQKILEQLDRELGEIINDSKAIFEQLVIDEPGKEFDLTDYANGCEQNRLYEIEIKALEEAIEEIEVHIAEHKSTTAQLDAAIALETDSAELVRLNAQRVVSINAESTAAADFVTKVLELIDVRDNQDLLDIAQEELVQDLTLMDLEFIFVDDGNDFPQNQLVDILINDARFQGQFDGRKFDTFTAMVPTGGQVNYGIRQNDNQDEFWVADERDCLKGRYCLLHTAFAPYFSRVIFVREQIGKRCFFEPPLWNIQGNGDRVPYLLDSFSGHIRHSAPFVIPSWRDISIGPNSARYPKDIIGVYDVPLNDFRIGVGDQVTLITGEPDLYVANLIPSISIHEIIGRRTSAEGIETLAPIPSSYYSYDLNRPIAGHNSTVIEFEVPLGCGDASWSDEVFVTLKSTVDHNTVNAIKHLIEAWSPLGYDTPSFDAVETSLANYPSHFALLEKSNLLSTIENIAWQARCGLLVLNEIAFLKYLSESETPAATISESKIQLDTLNLTVTPTEELVTKFIAEWCDDYSKEDDECFTINIWNNVPKYGLQEQTYDFFIYNIESLVLKSAIFWHIRYSNTWKRLTFTAFLDQLPLDPYDTVTLGFIEAIVANASVRGIVTSISYDSAQNSIQFEVESAVRLGEMTEYLYYWPASVPANSFYPTVDDPYVIIGDSSGQ